MAKNTRRAGWRREHQVQQWLEEHGWKAKKTKNSNSPYDIFAERGDRIFLVQVKANTGSPYKNFTPEDREELLEVTKRYRNGFCALVHWPPYGQPRLLFPRSWPL